MRLFKFQISIVLLLISFLFGCNKDNLSESEEDDIQIEEPVGLKSGLTKIYSVSTALDSNENKSAQIILPSEQDYIWDQGETDTFAFLHVKVLGVRGLLHGITLNGGTKQNGRWDLFENQEIQFDLKDAQNLVTTESASLGATGDLTAIIFYVSYIDLDVQFKGVKSTLRCFFKDHAETGAKSGDIMYNDNGTFKWVIEEGRQLTTSRPSYGMIRLNYWLLHRGQRNTIVFEAGHYDDVSWINNPPPWSDRGPNYGGGPFYTLSEENFQEDHDITIDISMVQAAVFTPDRQISDKGKGYEKNMRWIKYAVPFKGLEYVTDLEGNPFLSSEFNILDILPGLKTPYCRCNIEVVDK